MLNANRKKNETAILILVTMVYTIWLLFNSLKYTINNPLVLTLEIIVNVAFVFLLSLWLSKKANINSVIEYGIFILFILYLFVLHQYVSYINLQLYFLMDYVGHHHILFDRLNLYPFHTILESVSSSVQSQAEYIQLAGNLFLLTPFAFALLALQISKTAKTAVLTLLLVSIGIEVYQFIESFINSGFKYGEGRATDIDDVILNTSGAIIGVGLFKIYHYIGNFINKEE